MKTRIKLTVTAALVIAFAGASAGETLIEEIVVNGLRPIEVLPRIQAEQPTVTPILVIDAFKPELPAIEFASFALDRA